MEPNILEKAGKTIKNYPSLEEDLDIRVDLVQNKSSNNCNLVFEQEDERENLIKNIFKNKYFEEADFEEIYSILSEMNEAITIDINRKNHREYYSRKEKKFLSKSQEHKRNNPLKIDNSKECREILSIFKKPFPFKPLTHPKKVSLVGKVLYNVSTSDTTKSSSDKENEHN